MSLRWSRAALLMPGAVLALAGCAHPAPDTGTGAGSSAADLSACGGERYKIGDRAPSALAPPHRIIHPGDSYIMNYSPTRLNLEVDANGIITRVWCG